MDKCSYKYTTKHRHTDEEIYRDTNTQRNTHAGNKSSKDTKP